ncbi:Cytochrome c-type protein NapC [hydrothermal vent metagenome]|uniref:Cytochrome c-type protein NapC n=1 Tax=hydrothermal vent metagenome TaxID=652676 RepID=A0A3B0ZNA7_9ZZZZ
MEPNNSSDKEQKQIHEPKQKKYVFGGITTISIVSIFIGVLASSGFTNIMDWTNTEQFCVSCHEMQINLAEYTDTVHDKNRTGVATTCPDCHVPKDFGSKLLAKVRATKDIYSHLMGTIDTKEKYEKHRLTMAKKVWKMMRETDSKTCRSCHTVDSMAFEEQQGRAARKHKKMSLKGKTCIDCHKGIAHNLPKDYDEDDA